MPQALPPGDAFDRAAALSSPEPNSDPVPADVRRFYEDKAATYGASDPASTARYEKALALADLGPGQHIVDLGCKTGALFELLRARGLAEHYIGVDISERVLEQNRSRFPDTTFLQADVTTALPLPAASAHCVFALEILEHLTEPLRLLRSAAQLLTPAGRLILSVPNPYYYMEVVNELRRRPDTEGHLYSFRDANLRALLAHAGLSVVSSAGTYLEIPRRLRHAFRDQALWLLRGVLSILARSRIYVCAPIPR